MKWVLGWAWKFTDVACKIEVMCQPAIIHSKVYMTLKNVETTTLEMSGIKNTTNQHKPYHVMENIHLEMIYIKNLQRNFISLAISFAKFPRQIVWYENYVHVY